MYILTEYIKLWSSDKNIVRYIQFDTVYLNWDHLTKTGRHLQFNTVYSRTSIIRTQWEYRIGSDKLGVWISETPQNSLSI